MKHLFLVAVLAIITLPQTLIAGKKTDCKAAYAEGCMVINDASYADYLKDNGNCTLNNILGDIYNDKSYCGRYKTLDEATMYSPLTSGGIESSSTNVVGNDIASMIYFQWKDDGGVPQTCEDVNLARLKSTTVINEPIEVISKDGQMVILDGRIFKMWSKEERAWLGLSSNGDFDPSTSSCILENISGFDPVGDKAELQVTGMSSGQAAFNIEKSTLVLDNLHITTTQMRGGSIFRINKGARLILKNTYIDTSSDNVNAVFEIIGAAEGEKISDYVRFENSKIKIFSGVVFDVPLPMLVTEADLAGLRLGLGDAYKCANGKPCDTTYSKGWQEHPFIRVNGGMVLKSIECQKETETSCTIGKSNVSYNPEFTDVLYIRMEKDINDLNENVSEFGEFDVVGDNLSLSLEDYEANRDDLGRPPYLMTNWGQQIMVKPDDISTTESSVVYCPNGVPPDMIDGVPVCPPPRGGRVDLVVNKWIATCIDYRHARLNIEKYECECIEEGEFVGADGICRVPAPKSGIADLYTSRIPRSKMPVKRPLFETRTMDQAAEQTAKQTANESGTAAKQTNKKKEIKVTASVRVPHQDNIKVLEIDDNNSSFTVGGCSFVGASSTSATGSILFILLPMAVILFRRKTGV